MPTISASQRSKLEQSGRLHWFHWAVVGLSLMLTFGAWQFAHNQALDKVERQFDRESQQVIDLVQERMIKYEDALWAGVAYWNTTPEGIEHDRWHDYAESIQLDLKYPGINGIGVIESVEPEEMRSYLQRHRVYHPDFRVYPDHQEDEYLPISYIEPESTNAQALGLDMAHETNRYTAAIKARDSGTAQITGPIVLVQDSEKTPGFLFFAPKYRGSLRGDPDSRADNFEGMVYAPFVVQRLMQGVLAKDNRHVGIRLSDGDVVIYDELQDSEPDFDPEPMHTQVINIPMYGRNWSFEVATCMSFRAAQSDSQPLIILFGGLTIDALLIGLFLLLSRASRRSLVFADQVTKELQDRNAELEQFVYTASHDLKSPLISIQGFAGFLKQDIENDRHDRLHEFVQRIQDGTLRMRACIDDVLQLCKAGWSQSDLVRIDPFHTLLDLVAQMSNQIDEAGAEVTVSEDMPQIMYDETGFHQVFENLIANAIKYGRHAEGQLRITVGAEQTADGLHLYVQDNGPGIDPAYQEKIFGLFQRLQAGGDGTGVGLAIVKRVVESHGGKVWVESAPGRGARFVVLIPKSAQVAGSKVAA